MKKMQTKSYIRNKFAEYYQQNALEIQPPASIEKREFGFFLLNGRFMLRHKQFNSTKDLSEFLKSEGPSDVYFSAAYYEKPEAEMGDKNWVGADLIFDIDADHISTPCDKNHDIWICTKCNFFGRGSPPKNCPSCDHQRLDEKKWPCEVCLERAKVEMIKLIDILTKDFGLSPKEINVFFSGNRGYHLHVDNAQIRPLHQMARREIVDYLTGVGLEAKFHGLKYRKIGNGSPILLGPDLYDPGWRGRIARGTYSFLLTATKKDKKELEKIGLIKGTVTSLAQHSEMLLESWREKSPWGTIKGIGVEKWKKIVRKVVEGESVKIDTVVTTDVHRLIRLNNTLHGKTGLKKTSVSTSAIEQFDPLRSAVAFKKGTVNVLIISTPKFRLGGEIYGPYEREKVELPTAPALLLLCKGLAKLVP